MRIRHTLLLGAMFILTVALACGTPEPTATPAPTATPTPLPPLTGAGGGVIAFASDRDGNDEIFVMNLDGTDQRQLTHTGTSARNSHPAWSPDSSQIVFQAEPVAGRQNIQVMNANGTDVQQLTSGRNSRRPAWSPDGTRIAFDLWNGRNTTVCTIKPDGSDQQCLTQTSLDFDVFDPFWSPDGAWIACVLHSHPGSQDEGYRIYVLDVPGAQQDPEGDNLRRLIQSGDDEEDTPAWSPDGSQIAFSSVREGQSEIFIIDAGGTNLRRLTHNAFDDLHPTWSPDGSMIAFQSNPDGKWDIYVINIEDALQGTGDTGERRLTTSDANDSFPSWRP
jgi:Tol biopolymer transport system component